MSILKTFVILLRGELAAPKKTENKISPEHIVSFEKSLEDSLLRIDVKSEEHGSVHINNKTSSEVLLFFHLFGD